jgi:hypothetical protein
MGLGQLETTTAWGGLNGTFLDLRSVERRVLQALWVSDVQEAAATMREIILRMEPSRTAPAA